MPRVRVTDLFIYPVKSLAGIALSQTSLSYRGLLYDRKWMIVREDTGHFVSQRQLPRMCLINTRLDETRLTLASPTLMPGEAEVSVAIDGPSRPRRQATVWRDECRVTDMGDEVALWLSRALKSPKPLRLVAMAPDFRRLQSQPQRFGEQAAIFADAAPFLIANRDSLEILNQHLAAEDKPLARIEQFRPNIVIAGLKPFSEHSYNRLHSSGGSYTLQLHDPCERCAMIDVNLGDGSAERERHNYQTLAQLNPMPDKPRAAAFGENASLLTGDGQNIGVGDWLSIDRELQTADQP